MHPFQIRSGPLEKGRRTILKPAFWHFRVTFPPRFEGRRVGRSVGGLLFRTHSQQRARASRGQKCHVLRVCTPSFKKCCLQFFEKKRYLVGNYNFEKKTWGLFITSASTRFLISSPAQPSARGSQRQTSSDRRLALKEGSIILRAISS